ncbi:MAG: hypothetical protein R3E53_23160 [Myxococcota bacterium]
MEAALIATLDREIEGLEPFVRCDGLMRSDLALSWACEQLDLPDLWSFFSVHPGEASALLESAGLDPDEQPALAEPRWFSSEEGLRTVRGLLRPLAGGQLGFAGAAAAERDLRELERWLSVAATRSAEWRFGIDARSPRSLVVEAPPADLDFLTPIPGSGLGQLGPSRWQDRFVPAETLVHPFGRQRR